ncbi:MAG: DUF5615 family PIN-like protein [Acidobacteria bacterium]|nr:DUF5615 family PIN-like protein [Acidobacteriota bacterium]
MRVLLDEQLPRQLASELIGHDVSTVQREGWAGLENGALLAAAADRGFHAFVTKDQNLQFQQNLDQLRVGVVVLHAASHAIEVLRPLVPATIEAIVAVAPGEIRHVAV